MAQRNYSELVAADFPSATPEQFEAWQSAFVRDMKLSSIGFVIGFVIAIAIDFIALGRFGFIWKIAAVIVIAGIVGGVVGYFVTSKSRRLAKEAGITSADVKIARGRPAP